MLRVYSVFDNEKEMYSQPIFTPATYPDYDKQDVEAIRIFKAQLYDRHNLIALFPDKFDLCFVGEFDEKEGKFVFVENDSCPVVIISGDEAVKEMQDELSKN